MNKKPVALILGLALLVDAFIVGCAALKPGADPLVVRVEQAQSAASPTFDMVLRLDNAERDWWKTNAPAFHTWCEWLRTSTPYQGTNIARCLVMQFNVDDLKQSYKANKTAGGSNALYTAFGTLSTALSQSSSWINIVTNSVHP